MMDWTNCKFAYKETGFCSYYNWETRQCEAPDYLNCKVREGTV